MNNRESSNCYLLKISSIETADCCLLTTEDIKLYHNNNLLSTEDMRKNASAKS